MSDNLHYVIGELRERLEALERNTTARIRDLSNINQSQLELIKSLGGYLRECVRMSMFAKVGLDALIDELRRCEIVELDPDPSPCAEDPNRRLDEFLKRLEDFEGSDES